MTYYSREYSSFSLHSFFVRKALEFSLIACYVSCVCVRVHVRVCVCVRVCERERKTRMYVIESHIIVMC